MDGIKVSAAARRFAALLAFCGAFNVFAQTGATPADRVENGIIALRPPTHGGLILFDRRSFTVGPSEFEGARWIQAQLIKANPSILQNANIAKTTALMFLPAADLDRFFDCGLAPCGRTFAGSAFGRTANSQASIMRFKGNEFESVRAQQDFISTYGGRIAAAAPTLPQEAYIAGIGPLAPYSASDGGFKFYSTTPFSSGGTNEEIGLQHNACAPTDAVIPSVFKLDPTEAEKVAQRIDARRKPDYPGAAPSRLVSMLLKVRIEAASLGRVRCGWTITPLTLDVTMRQSLTDVLAANLPIGRVVQPVARTAPPPRSDPPPEGRAPAPQVAAAPEIARTPPAAAGTSPSTPIPDAPRLQSPQGNASPPASAAAAPAGAGAQAGNMNTLPRRNPSAAASPGPDIVGIRLGMSMDQARSIANEHLKPELVYELSIEGPSTGYPKGLALVSLKQGKALFIYTGDATPGLVSGVERTVIADSIDVKQVQEQYRERYMTRGSATGLGKSSGAECGVAFTSKANKPVSKLVSGRLPNDADQQRVLARLMQTSRRLHVHPLPPGKDRTGCGPGMFLSTVGSSSSNAMLTFTMWDHSKASFDPEPPRRSLKL